MIRIRRLSDLLAFPLILIVALIFSRYAPDYIRGSTPTTEAPSASESRPVITLNLNGQPLTTELVWLPADTQQGLGDRPSMSNDQGMLFVFGTPAVEPFWMRHMQFPLDIIYLKDGSITEIAANLPPPAQTAGIPKTYVPSKEADMVLEVNAGQTAQMKPGQQILDQTELQLIRSLTVGQ